MKKVGICACYDSRNYGSMLQAYATQVAIENLGFESEYIVYQKRKDIAYCVKQVPRLFNRNLMFDKMMVFKKQAALKKHPEQQKNENVRSKAFQRFKDTYYGSFSKPYYGYDELKEGAKNYSSVVVGSDQLWTPGGLATNFYNLMFVPDNINKVSYATSFGVSSIPWYQKNRTREYLRRINSLSVREVKGAEIVKEIAGREAKVVVDPTLLLTKEQWEEKIPSRVIIDEPYIFCYFLGENIEHRDIANELQKQTGKKIVCTPYLDSYVEEDEQFGDYQLFDVGPDDFVNLIRGADFVLTDSFHGSVFSIIHHKRFIVLNRFSSGTQSRNSRIDSLCNSLGLEDRRYDLNTDIYCQIDKPINYNEVDHKKETLRNESLAFLSNSLKEELIGNRIKGSNALMNKGHIICSENDCTGCAACSSSCQVNAITMKLDKRGFWRPEIDTNLCIGCNSCNRVCPVNCAPKTYGATEAYAFQNNDAIRFNSTSGGFFNAIASKVIERGGVVCGAAFDNNMVLKHTFIERIEELDPLQRSKYVQSATEGVYQRIKEYLEAGRKVLFVGVGCQAAGLRNYIGEDKNLTIVDVVCYGVPSSGMFMDWIEYLYKKYGKILDVRFRDKTYGYASPNVKVILEKGKSIESCRDVILYTNLFFRNLSIRDACYKCHFKTIDRTSDLTLGDLWSIGRYDKDKDDNKGTTVVFAHTEKGKRICSLLGCMKIDVDSVVETDGSRMVNCVKPDEDVDVFWKKYTEEGFNSLIDTYVKDSLKNRSKYYVKRFMNLTGISSGWYRRKKTNELKNS